jgi:Fur family transcriptional regulator, ferric uptake regulator
MTPARTRRPLGVDSFDGAIAALRAGGLRVSAARRLVLEALFAADGPVSADHIAGGGDGRGTPLEPTSVYRNLEHLEAMGIVRHVHLGHGPGLYALIGQGEREYLVCEACGAVTAVEPARLDAARAAIRAELGYEARFTHFAVHGLCGACAAGDRADI